MDTEHATATSGAPSWWKRKRFLLPITALVSLLLGVGIGSSGSQPRIDELESELASARESEQATEAEMADLVDERDEIQDDLAEAEDELADAIAAAEDAQAVARAEARERINAAKQELEAARQELEEREAAVAAREQKVAGVEESIENNTFGDGVWGVGRDIDPGTYRSPGGGGCYWAVLGSANPSDIINNGGFSANQTITLSSGQWFETSDCGEWTPLS